jgi:hypothetical protein
MPQLLRIAPVAVCTVACLLALAWLGLAGIDYLTRSCHGVRECSPQVSFLNDAFGLFFGLGVLIDGAEWLIRWRCGPRA